MKEVQNFVVWRAKPVFEKLFVNAENGKLRYAAKKNLRKMEPLFEDILEWIRGDKEEHGWEATGNGFPEEGDAFFGRFEEFLLGEKVEYTPHLFSEELMQHADGINGLDELVISFAFTENQVEDEDNEDEE